MVKNGKTKKKYHKPTKPHHHSSSPPAQQNKPITVKTLPTDLLLEILYRTPVKSLVRCTCVSKSWFALIHNPTFIQMHLNFNTSRNKLLICSICCDDKSEMKDFNGDYSRRLIALLGVTGPPMPILRVDRHFTDRPNYPKKINFPDFAKRMCISGSINGIVCLAHYAEMSERFVALWNPGTNYWNPIDLVKTKSWDNTSFGFGFDAVKSDYKIICIVPESRLKNFGRSRVEIYSSNQGSWENVDGKRIIPFWPEQGLRHCNFIINGVPYWMGVDVQEKAVKSTVLGRIDPLTGFYKKVMYPTYVKNKCTAAYPVKWKDSVAILIHSPGEYPNQIIDLYVLLNENTSEWTKMYSIGPLNFDHVFERLQIPQAFSTGEIVLETWTQSKDIVQSVDRYICDPKTDLVFCNKEIEALNPAWYESYSHVESLVWVKGMVQIGKEHKDKKTSPKMKNWTEFLSKEFESALHL
ncbi:putative F-box protein At1g46984 [Apium graveolens]|uniref:putative F-box protein At1g46984 n=1 Tax=Apium graveolens TaxID=4045 RepID=UPI003D7BE4E1